MNDDTVAMTVGSLEYKQEAGSRCRYSFVEQERRCSYRSKTEVILLLFWVAAQLPTLYNTGRSRADFRLAQDSISLQFS